jgi:hypothetical protein
MHAREKLVAFAQMGDAIAMGAEVATGHQGRAGAAAGEALIVQPVGDFRLRQMDRSPGIVQPPLPVHDAADMVRMSMAGHESDDVLRMHARAGEGVRQASRRWMEIDRAGSRFEGDPSVA